MITRPFTTRGAIVIVYGRLGSTVITDQTTRPVFASSAWSLPSSVPTYTRPRYTATPRFTTSQHACAPFARGTCGSWRHRSLPVRASIANTTLHGPVVYSTPSTAIGVASCPRDRPVSKCQASPSRSTLLASICASLL